MNAFTQNENSMLELLHSLEEDELTSWEKYILQEFGSDETLIDDATFLQHYAYDSDYLEHEGVAHDNNPPGRGSGRYAYGSGDAAYQRAVHTTARIAQLRRQINPDTGEKYTENEIAKIMNYKSTNEMRTEIGLMEEAVRNYDINHCKSLFNEVNPDTGETYNPKEISKITGLSQSTVYRYLKEDSAAKITRTQETADTLRSIMDQCEYLDVGKGAEAWLDVSPERLKKALAIVEQDDNYIVKTVRMPNASDPNHTTPMKVLMRKDAENFYKHTDQLKTLADYLDDDHPASAKERLGTEKPNAIDLSRVQIRYDEDGGTDKDGMIEIRATKGPNGEFIPASPDLSLGNSKYAQVRILVNAGEHGERYIKGMAVYNTDPNAFKPGQDIIVNSNKSVTDGVDAALKKVKRDKNGEMLDNPFGTNVVQSHYIDANGESKLSSINVVGTLQSDAHNEGSWNDWGRNLPSQFLGKQSLPLIKQQLGIKYKSQEAEFDSIMQIENTVVRAKMLKDFSDSCDTSATNLKAASFPDQKTHVILSVPSLGPNEVYAPNYPTGTKVALVRFPHAGPFEIVEAVVNNNNKEAQSFMKGATDAIGIRPSQASKLSGADFDGDTVTVIPQTRLNKQTGEFDTVVRIHSTESLPGLKDFNPTEQYGPKAYPGQKYKIMSEEYKQKQMGIASNLITDMYAKGCQDPYELSRAVRWSMIVIDAHKHKLNYVQAEKELNIKELKEKYQSNADGTGGASSLLSRAKSPVTIDKRSPRAPKINPETGEYEYYQLSDDQLYYPERKKIKAKGPDGKYLKDENGDYIYEKNDYGRDKKVETGKMLKRTQEVPRMQYERDANKLLSDHPSDVELLYADYANKCMAMANKARKEYLATPNYDRDPKAAKEYAAEVESLTAKLNESKKNYTRERQAQSIANQIIKGKLDDNPELWDDKEDLKKVRTAAIRDARYACNANRADIHFTDREWEAVQKHAISKTRLEEILRYADQDEVKERANPRKPKVTDNVRSLVKALSAAGYTQEEIAQRLPNNISPSTVSDIVNNTI